MKLKFLLIALFLLFLTNGFSQTKKIEKAVIKTTLNCDHCVQCETCGKKFNAELYKIKGLKMYELNESEMTFTVYYNPKKTNLTTIKDKISALGYDADDIKANVLAYESLDDCCKIK